jgi:hypothetical protein
MPERRRLRTLCTSALITISIAVMASGAPGGVQALPGQGSVHASATTIVVTSAADSGPGTLRQAMEQAQSGDTVTFDPAVFPPTAPATISITSILPTMWRGNVTIDASDAGVILDGSSLPGDWTPGFQIVGSHGNRIRGLQISNFSGRAIDISGDSQHNVIGGDRNVGAGPYGQGNLLIRNGNGIVITQEAATQNTIAGNLIGTDAAGTSGLGNGKGIWIVEGANGNVIGPDNVIAHNWTTGIVVQDQGSLYNTITQNSIHDNGFRGINLREGGNNELLPPVILDFDLAAGTVYGFTCSNCTVEIFSDSADEGEVYEGRAIANSNGVYAFARGVSFTGPHLTATATDADGNTSEFSLLTSGTVGRLIVQRGSDLPRVRLVADRFEDLKDNRIGDSFPLDRHSPPCPPVEEDWPFAHVRDLNLKWVRLSLDPLELEQARSWGHYSQFDISPCQDEVIGFLAENDVTILMTIVYWDEELHAQNYPDYRNEEEIQRYLDYTRTIVRQFRGRVQYYEILNEAYFYVHVGDYINLIRRAVPVIREEDPDAKIVVGGTSNLLNLGFRNYLFGVIGSDIMPLVDGIATHPMYGASPQYPDVRRYYYNYPSLVQGIKDAASANGFTGEYFAEEMCWRTAINPFVWEPWEYTPTVAAKYYARGIMMHLGMDVWAGIGGELYWEIPPIVSIVRNLGTVMAGARPVSLPVKVQSAATNLVSYTFTLDNRNRLIALWTDGIAVDNDPGVEATLTLPGVSDHAVTGIDVLFGFQQQMVTSEEQGGLVIRDLVVRDYPILLRVTPIRYVFLPVVLRGPGGQNQVDADCPGACGRSVGYGKKATQR